MLLSLKVAALCRFAMSLKLGCCHVPGEGVTVAGTASFEAGVEGAEIEFMAIN